MSTKTESITDDSERDEVKEVRKEASKETARVRVWRTLVTLTLLATAIAVTVTTYFLLVQQEDKNFRNVYDQFARTVADAAIEQQTNLQIALTTLEDNIAVSAQLAGNGTSPWPYFLPPMFEANARNFKTASKAEFIGFSNFVTHAQRLDNSYIDHVTSVYQKEQNSAHMIAYGHTDFLNKSEANYQPYISKKKAGSFPPDEEREFYFCRSVQSPPMRSYKLINLDMLANKVIRDGHLAAMSLRESIITAIKPFNILPAEEHKLLHSNGVIDNPHSFTYHPMRESPGDPDSPIIAMAAAASAWDVSMRNLLPDNVKGMFCVLENTCNQTATYRIDGKDALYLGPSDMHPSEYNDLALFVDLNLQKHPLARSTPGHCIYSMRIYPSKAFEEDYKTNTPVIFASVVAGTFLLVVIIYFVYDITVHKRNEVMVKKAATANAVVTSFVPDHLRDRLMDAKAPIRSNNLKSFLNDGKNGAVRVGKPLADLFVDTTVLFADISGFTAWSSVREPTQVFTLLETIYQAFDRIAKRRRIFKVETVGDCYVAVSGLPDPRKDHAVAMARFARDILCKMRVVTKKLEVILGPDTGELDLRIGIHSGPVTAGVLRGDRSRFQLFGDTMNTCARLESTSRRGRVQASKETAEHIQRAGFGSWLERRSDPIHAKGKGELESYWVRVDGTSPRSVTSSVSDESSIRSDGNMVYGRRLPGLDDRTYRLINWNCETLLRVLKQIVAHRSSKQQKRATTDAEAHLIRAGAPLDEVREIITLPEFDESAAKRKLRPEESVVPSNVVTELHRLVSVLASMYNDNPFHNFEHASHVVMSVTKLLSRIVAPSHLKDLDDSTNDMAESLHDHTYGITSDPLTQFACAFSALIHDVDHEGVSNAQLVKERSPMAEKYLRSVAEQNSLDLSWDLLMGSEYFNLRKFLFPTEAELVRFRQLVVNSVMATDIVDKDLKALRNARWDKAFKTGNSVDHVDENPRDEVNRKATIIIEHIIQASDISHTMQHWHVYRKWNQKLFEELYLAYLNGRMDTNPADFWYKGEFGFFDFYIIPLTQKLKDCGVFGVSSDEYLNYARQNREEWEAKGQEVVANMVEEMRKKYGVRNGQAVLRKDYQAPEQHPLSQSFSRLDDVQEVEEGMGETDHAKLESMLLDLPHSSDDDDDDLEYCDSFVADEDEADLEHIEGWTDEGNRSRTEI